MNDISQLTIDEMAKLSGGEDFWHSYGIEEKNVPRLTMSDGPHGLRKQNDEADHLGIHDSIKAVCFPSAGCIASSFDRKIARKMGELLGEECRAEGVHILLGPAINIKRSPLCGRNFEYYSEDPYLAGELAADFVKGVESQGVGTCVKHYAANNQENGRMTVSADMDERTLREIYLAAFEKVIKEKPSSVMSSYNKINGEYVGESYRLLSELLRDKFKFEGIVISDWYAVSDRIAALKAGLDLEMPGGPLVDSDKITNAVNCGDLDVEILKRNVSRIVDTARRLYKPQEGAYDKEIHHEFATKFAAESAVLLKNDGIFPISKDDKVLFIGAFAKKPRYQGGGSSHINAYKVDSVLDYTGEYNVTYYDGMNASCDENEIICDVNKIIDDYDKVIIFAGLPDEYESEGYDRKDIFMPKQFDTIIDKLSTSNKMGVVLFNGSPIAMDWRDKVRGILTMQLGGEGVGKACIDILTGRVNPSGRLQETYPIKLQDTPSYLNSKGLRHVKYNEGVFVGYRYYVSKELPVLYPFGYGLSYTEFEYSEMRVVTSENEVNVFVKIKNVGKVAGKEVVQVYVYPPKSDVDRPTCELKGFDKILLGVGESKVINISLDRRAFAFYDEELDDFYVAEGKYTISFNKDASTVILSEQIDIKCDDKPLIITDNVTVGELIKNSKTAKFMLGLLGGYNTTAESDAISSDMKKAMIMNAPIRLVKGIAKMTDERYEGFKLKLIELLTN